MEITEKQRKTIFSILLKKDLTSIKHIGTGFFIGFGGLFFTCGHTFRKIEQEIVTNGLQNIFVAFQDHETQIFKVKRLIYKSYEIYKQKGPEYLDYAIGVINYQNSDFLIFNRKRPKNGELLSSIGFYNTKSSKQYELTGDLAKLDSLTMRRKQLEVISQEPLISDLPRDYQKDPKDVTRSRFFNNCVGLDGILFKGESGCPIIDNLGLVRGVYLASSEFNQNSVMALSKHCTKMIRYRSYFKYDTYQDLNLR